MMLFSFMGGVSFGGRLRARGSGCGHPKATPPSLRLHTFRAYLSTQRPCDSSQVNIRAHPPIEPARDQGAHGRAQAPGDCVTGLLWFSDLESVDIKILCSLAPQLTAARDGSSRTRGVAIHGPHRRLGDTDGAA